MSDDDDVGVDIIGRVLHTQDLRSYFNGASVRGYSGFRAPKGSMFAVLVIGCEEIKPKGNGPIARVNINDFLKSHGWTPPKPRRKARKEKKP